MTAFLLREVTEPAWLPILMWVWIIYLQGGAVARAAREVKKSRRAVELATRAVERARERLSSR